MLRSREDVLALLQLAKCIHPNQYRARRIHAPFARDSAGSPMVVARLPVSLQCLVLDSRGRFHGLQTDSNRSIRIGEPWRFRGRWLCGLELKGVGSKGRPPEPSRIGHRIEGGIELDMAAYEFLYNRRAARAGVWCQESLAVFDPGWYFNLKKFPFPVRAGVLVRAATSPLRANVVLGRGHLEEYLSLRGEAGPSGLRDYLQELGVSLGRAIRGLYGAGLVHHTMDASNVSSEGELMDFEPVPYEPEEGVTDDTQPLQVIRSVYSALASYRWLCGLLPRTNPGFAPSAAQGEEYFFENHAPAVSQGLVGEECTFRSTTRTWHMAHKLTEQFLGEELHIDWARYWNRTPVGPVFNALYNSPKGRMTVGEVVRATRLPTRKVRTVLNREFSRHLEKAGVGDRTYYLPY